MTAPRKVFVIAPSPLAGEGYSGMSAALDWVRGSLHHKASCDAAPSPHRDSLQHPHALSHEGRGRSNSRLHARRGTHA
jgi:hypothetical protein